MLNVRPTLPPDLMENRRSPLDYRILTDIDQIAEISSEWNRLLEKSRCNRAYSCSKWYLATPELCPQLQPLVFIAQRHGVLAGILPLWLDSSQRLARFGDNYGDHPDIIATDDDLAVITGLLALALQGTGSYDRLVLGQVKHDSNYVKAARALGLGEAVDEFFLPGKSLIYAVLDLTCGYDEYMKTLGQQFRFNLRCDRKRADRDGIIVRELTSAELKPESLPEIFLSLHLSRFGDRSDFKSSGSWMQKLFPSLFAEKRMRVFAILEESRIVGIDLAMVTRSGMYAYNVGFLPEIRRYAPGKLLIHKAIQQACLEGLDEYDLGWLGQEHKLHWKPTRREVGALQFALHPQVNAGSKIPQVKNGQADDSRCH
jgi:CelD/BcsL family acetyltransferase involved in cellulose biosynthesis